MNKNEHHYTLEKIEEKLQAAKKNFMDCLDALDKKILNKQEVTKQEIKEKNDLKGIYNDYVALRKTMLKPNVGSGLTPQEEQFVSKLHTYVSNVASIKVSTNGEKASVQD